MRNHKCKRAAVISSRQKSWWFRACLCSSCLSSKSQTSSEAYWGVWWKARGAGSQALGPSRLEPWVSGSFSQVFFSCSGHSFHTHEMGGETVGDCGCRETSPRAGTTVIPVGNDFRGHRPKRKQLNKKGNGFSILLLSFRLHNKEKSSCWCLYDNSSLHLLPSSLTERASQD